MRALTAASLLAATIAGSACSDRAPVEPETVSAEADAEISAETPDAADTTSTSRFNLRYPGTDAARTGQTSSGFNLRDPNGVNQQDSGFRLPEGAVRENAFDDIPEIRAPSLEDQPVDPVTEENPDDAIIRLD